MVLTQSARRRFQTALSYVLLLSGAALIMIPLVWMVSTSLKEPSAVYTFPPKIVPDPVRWSNFPESLTIAPFGRFYVNTTIVTLANIVGHLLSCSLVAFAFARLRAPGKNLLFMLVLSTVMIPFYVRMIPLFILYRTFGWLDTLLPLIVPAFLPATPSISFSCASSSSPSAANWKMRRASTAALHSGCTGASFCLSQPALAMIGGLRLRL